MSWVLQGRWKLVTGQEQRRDSLSSVPGCAEQLLESDQETALRGTVYRRSSGALLMNMIA